MTRPPQGSTAPHQDQDVRSDPNPETRLRRAGPVPALLAAAAAALIAAFGVQLIFDREPSKPPAAAATQPPSRPSEPDVVVTVDPAQVRSALQPVSSHPSFLRWIGFDDALRRAAVVVDNLGEGVSPRAQLGFLAPRRGFTVTRVGDATVIAKSAYARYDGFAAAVASVDASALETAYGSLRPALQSAYRLLGHPGASIDEAVVRALKRIVDAPVVDGDVVVVARGGAFVLADAELEKLGAVEKHLLRMGARNTRTLQAKAGELLAALPLDGGGATRTARR